MSDSKKTSTPMIVGGVAVVALLAALLWPKKAAAATTPNPIEPPPDKKKCPDGSQVPVGATCPVSIPPSPPAPPGCGFSLNTATPPQIVVLASGKGEPAASAFAALPFSLAALPASATSDPCAVAPTDALVFLQAWDLASGYQPVFPDPGGIAPVAGVAPTTPASTGIAKAVDPAAVFGTKTSLVSNYFDPKITPKLAQLLAPGTIVLIWTTDLQGNALAWWITTWSPASVVMT